MKTLACWAVILVLSPLLLLIAVGAMATNESGNPAAPCYDPRFWD